MNARPENHAILPPKFAIKAMRDSGYKDTAYAVAELVDNSIQAGDMINDCTHVEVICLDQRELVSERRHLRMDKIAVFDDAAGMDPETLRLALQFGAGTRLQPDLWTGIGKFGMGLPNASISQCKRVDVWSWQNHNCYHTYLDLGEIERGMMVEVPEPQPAKFPEEYREYLRSTPGKHGTFVVWSQLDRVKWRSSKAFFRNSEFLIGRMYRHFLNSGQAVIRMAAFETFDSGEPEKKIDRDVRPNDPLYLMKNTSAPAPYDEMPAFEELCEDELIEVVHKGNPHTIRIKYSIAKKETRGVEGGHADIGKHTKKNIGVSVVRANREIDMNTTFVDQSDTRERWWGIELHFDPALDDVFGVTNNKQAATAFRSMDLDEDAKAEEMTPGEFREQLAEEQDSRLILYQVSSSINSTLSTIRKQIKSYTKGTRSSTETKSAEEIGTKITNKRRKELGATGRSDKDDETLADKEKTEVLAQEGLSAGLSEAEALERAEHYVRKKIKFIFEEMNLPGAMMFDVASMGGKLIIRLNSCHPVTENLYELLQKDELSDALNALQLLIMAWARLEDEASDELRQRLEDIRTDWGRIARDYVKAINE